MYFSDRHQIQDIRSGYTATATAFSGRNNALIDFMLDCARANAGKEGSLLNRYKSVPERTQLTPPMNSPASAD